MLYATPKFSFPQYPFFELVQRHRNIKFSLEHPIFLSCYVTRLWRPIDIYVPNRESVFCQRGCCLRSKMSSRIETMKYLRKKRVQYLCYVMNSWQKYVPTVEKQIIAYGIKILYLQNSKIYKKRKILLDETFC